MAITASFKQSDAADVEDGAIRPNELDRGNHFAAWQEPEIFTNEVRAAFRSLR